MARRLWVFEDQGGLDRIDASAKDESENLQLVVGAADLLGRIGDPQDSA